MKKIPGTQVTKATVVVPDGLAARQWQAHLAAEPLARGACAWASPPVEAYRRWTEALWERLTPLGPHLLASHQSEALWRCVIGDSASGRELLGTQGVARWAADAWRRLHAARFDPAQLASSGGEVDFSAFLDWARAFGQALRDAKWLDAAELDSHLTARTDWHVQPQRIVTDIPAIESSQQALLDRLSAAGWQIEPWCEPVPATIVGKVALSSADEELLVAALWAGRQLAQAPQRRVALVIRDLSERRDDVQRLLADALSPAAEAAGAHDPINMFMVDPASLDRAPLIGAAVNGLQLFSGRADFACFSRFLRSPFFGDESQRCKRALLEAQLRSKPVAGVEFLPAYRQAGLRQLIANEAPSLARCLDQVLQYFEAAGRQSSPAKWAQLWELALRGLAWQGSDAANETPWVHAWQAAVTDFVQLTPVVGELPPESALAEMAALLGRRRAPDPWPTSGLFVVQRLEDVGPGYDAVWVTGLNEDGWPPPEHSSPLLPSSVLRRYGLPPPAPQDALESCRQRMQRLISRAAAVVLSWPQQGDSLQSAPSPLLDPYPDVDLAAVAGRPQPRRSGRLLGSRRQEILDDPAPPLAGRIIPGGASTLGMQARCPLQTFCERRLGAEPLPPLTRGLRARQRGIATHRALELLLTDQPSQAPLAGSGRRTRERIDACATQALDEIFGGARGPLKALFGLEREQLAEGLWQLVQCDLRRRRYRVSAVEQHGHIVLGDWHIAARIDRIDALADGSDAIIDYKTGATARPADWFEARLGDTQIPLYSLLLGDTLSAAAMCSIRPDAAQYRGVWSQPGEFPGQAWSLPAGRSWPEQLDVWRQQLLTLAGEFAAGDTHLLIEHSDLAGGALAPLSRVRELLAISRGAPPSRDAA